MAKDKNQEVAVVGKKTPARCKKTTLPRIAEETKESMTMEQVLYHAIDMKTDPNALEKLFELYERDEARKAEKEFNSAMAKFQAECPIIEKSTDGAKNKTRTEVLWKFASLSDIIKVAKEPLSRNGLSYSWNSEDVERDGKLGKKTICTITHLAGHTKPSVFTSCLFETAGALMNDTQKEESTIEIGRRQSLKLALGIIVAGEDNEGQSKNENGKAVETITKAQTKLLEKQIGTADETLYNAILTEYNITELYKIPADKLADCKDRITEYKKAKREREKEKAQKEAKQTSMEIAP